MSFRKRNFVFWSLLILAGCGGSPEQKEARYVKHGNELFEQGEYDKALVEYKNAAKLKATDPEIGYRVGLINEAKGQFREAFGNFTRSEQQDSHYHPALLKLAEYYIAGDMFEPAQKRLGTVLADSPDDPEAHALSGALALHQKDYATAEKEARFALSKDASNITAYAVLTGLYSAQNDSAKAMTAVEDGIAHNPKNMPLLLLRTDLYQKSGDIAKTAEAYEAIFKLAPKEIKYRGNLAAIYTKAGQLDNAEKVLRDAIAEQPDNWDMKHQLVLFLGDNRDAAAVEKEISAYIQANPKQSEPYMWQVDYDLSHNAYDKAMGMLNGIMARNEFDKLGLYARSAVARIDYLKGDKTGAQTLTDQVLQKDPNNLDARFLRAKMQADNGAYQDAVIELRGILRDKPNTEQALQLLAEMLLMQKHLDLAIETLNQLAELNPQNYAARVRLAQLYHMNNDSHHAMDMLFLITKAAPTFAPAWETTARIAIDQKDWSTAENAIQTLDGLPDQHPVVLFLRAEIASLNGKSEDALGLYTQVVGTDPSRPLAQRALVAIVSIDKSLNKMDDAVHYIESLKSNDPMVETILGDCYLAQNKPDQAATQFDAAIAGNAAYQDPYVNRARLYFVAKQYDQALEALKKGAAAAPADPRALLMEAEAYEKTGRYQDSLAIYDDLLKRNPQMDAIANNLAEIIADHQYTDAAAMDKARQVAERFVASTNPLFMDTLAWVYFRSGDMQNAQIYADRAMTAMGDKAPPQARYHYGAILLKAGKTAEAKNQLEKATVSGVEYPGLDDAKKLSAGL